MATGLSIPVGVGPDGRAKLDTGDDQLVKIIGLHLSCADSENPYQDIGVDQVVFNLNDRRLQPFIRYRLGVLFARLAADQRAKLDDKSVAFSHSNDGELTLSFKFWNLETNKPVDFFGTVDLISGRVAPQ